MKWNLKITTKILLLCVLLVILTATLLGVLNYVNSENLFEANLIQEKQNELKINGSYIRAKIGELRNDVQFLSSTPPIEGVIRAEANKGYDPKDKSSTDQWLKRLETIFREMLHAKEIYTQIRLIGTANDGKELLRVERRGLKIERTADFDLQKKADREYFQQALAVGRGNVSLSKFELNKEYGKITYPLQMVLRAAIPIHINNQEIFGTVIINMDYQEIFSNLDQKIDLTDFFAVDLDGNILHHTNSRVQEKIGSTTGYNLHNYNKTLGSHYPPKNDSDYYDLNDRSQPSLIVSRKISYDPINPNNFLVLYSSTQRRFLELSSFKHSTSNLLLILVLIILSSLAALWFSRLITRPIEKLNKFAKELSTGKKVDFRVYDNDKDDEIGFLTRNLINMSQEIVQKNDQMEKQFEAVNASAIVAETDISGRITYANDKFVEISKYVREELIGQDHRILNSGEHSKTFFKDMWNTIKSGRVWAGEVKNIAKDGSHYWVATTIYPVKNKGGLIQKYVAIRFDITDRKEIESQLVDARAQAENAVKIKSSFLANMSHEIRTPLNGILGCAQILESQLTEHDNRSLVEVINRSGDTLLTLLNDILDFSKLEAQSMQIAREPYNLVQSAQDVVSLFTTKTQEKNIDLICNIEKEMHKFYYGDEVRFKQVLTNLISNAIKFTAYGQVSLEISTTKFGPSTNEILVKITDTGIGIPENAIDKLFTSFSQVDASINKNYGGTGLGLAICRELVELMGGEIWAESIIDKGSTFTFKLPLTKTNEQVIVQEPDVPMPVLNKDDMKLLIADDNEINRLVAKKVFEKMGLTPDFANDGSEAVMMVSKNDYDIVFMDCSMPELDGYEATAKIRQMGATKVQPFIVAMTANSSEEDKQKCFACGMDQFITKPINVEHIKKLILLHKQRKDEAA